MPIPGQDLLCDVDKSEEKARVKDDVVVDVLASGPGILATTTRAEERRLVRKLDRRIIPMLAIMNLFSGLSFLCVGAFFAETNLALSS